jgi:Phage-related protein, predicted endonuclease
MHEFKPPQNVITITHEPDSKEWELERRNGIGGSDLEHFTDSPWACLRKLFYSKTRDSDFGDAKNYRLTRGKRQEPVARAFYVERTGRRVISGLSTFATNFKSAKDYGETRARVNVDGITERDGELGALEIKTLGKDSFQKYKRHGIPAHYLLQPQWAAGILGLGFTSLALFSPEQDELIWFDIPYDEEAFKRADSLAGSFWGTYLHRHPGADPGSPSPVPERLEDNGACFYCDYRKTCRGITKSGIDKSLF